MKCEGALAGGRVRQEEAASASPASHSIFSTCQSQHEKWDSPVKKVPVVLLCCTVCFCVHACVWKRWNFSMLSLHVFMHVHMADMLCSVYVVIPTC